MDHCLVYVTCPSLDEARAIAREVVGDRLAACANLVDGVESLYWWEGQLTEGREVLLLLKTKRALYSRLEERVRALHSYKCPCIVALGIEEGLYDFLDWISHETLEGEAGDGGS